MSQNSQKLIELGRALMKRGSFQKQEFLANYTALSRTEAATVLGCRPRDLHEHLKPDYVLNGRGKYLIASVRAKQNELITRSAKIA